MCLCVLAGPSNYNSVLSSRIASLIYLCLVVRRESDSRMHRCGACCSHKEILFYYSLCFILNDMRIVSFAFAYTEYFLKMKLNCVETELCQFVHNRTFVPFET